VEDERRAKSNSKSATLLALVIGVAVLYVARMVFVPLALALLLAFLLGPLVRRLHRLGLGRVPSAILVVLFSFALLGAIGLGMASQLTDLAHRLPGYQQNVHRKVEAILSSGGGLFERISSSIHSISDELKPTPGNTPKPPPHEEPVPVEIRHPFISVPQLVQETLGSVLRLVVMAAIVVVFVIFILIQREDLRDRLLRLAGERRINATVELIDDAAHRVSRYLLAQLLVNVFFGGMAGLGVWLIGVPNPLLWGMVAALLRYVPYLGIWIAAAMPAIVAFAVEPGWVKVPMIFGLYFVVDLLMYNCVEPLLYGSSTGISPLAILLAAVFWTWLWGPVGLLLATPLTVCIVVIGHYVPSLRFLSVLLGDNNSLKPATRFYQRLLAMGLPALRDVARGFLKKGSLEELYDEVVLPALARIELEHQRGQLSDERRAQAIENTRLLVEEFGAASLGRQPKARGAGRNGAGEAAGAAESQPLVACVPVQEESDELAAMMLVQLLKQHGVEAEMAPAGLRWKDLVERIRQRRIACIVAVAPSGFGLAQGLSQRLNIELSGLRVIVALLTNSDVGLLKGQNARASNQETTSSLAATVRAIFQTPAQAAPGLRQLRVQAPG
jgi:predicted PurR-regulated permease PerM